MKLVGGADEEVGVQRGKDPEHLNRVTLIGMPGLGNPDGCERGR